ncbi:MAG: hypothetical protein HY039_03915 [Nitrospirae bacterium]|nr:hypothetical protein [Nitrospirota bacterium]
METPHTDHVLSWRFRIAFFLKFGFSVAAAALASGAAFYITNNFRIGPTYGEGIRVIERVDAALSASLVYSALFQLAAAGLAVAGIALYVSHGIAGPLVRLEKRFGAAARGDIGGSVRLRAGDQVTALAGALNEAMLDLRLQVGRLRDLTGVLAELEKRVEEGGAGGRPDPDLASRLRTSVGAVRLDIEKWAVE